MQFLRKYMVNKFFNHCFTVIYIPINYNTNINSVKDTVFCIRIKQQTLLSV